MSEIPNTPKLGLVTILYNGSEVLPEFFESLGKQTYQNFVLYVIDNSPDDEALDLAKVLAEKYDVAAEFINNNANLGVAKGNNQGIKLSLENNCDYVLLLNNDIDFDSDVIASIVEYSLDKQEYIVAPKIYYAGSNKLWFAGARFDMLRALTPHRGDLKEDLGEYNQIEHVEYCPTCFVLINSIVFDQVGFMDEDYFVYYDDTDWMLRAKDHGYKVLYFPRVTINHKVSFSTGGNESDFSYFYGNRNRLMFIHKNYSFVKKIISLTYIYSVLAIKLLLKGKRKRNLILKAIKESRPVKDKTTQ